MSLLTIKKYLTYIFIYFLVFIPLLSKAQQYQFVREISGYEQIPQMIEFNSPSDIKIDDSGNMYVLDLFNNRIQKFDSEGNALLKWGTQGSGDGQFYFPGGIALDGAGNVYVTDINNHRIQKFDSEGNFILKWGSQGNADGAFNSPAGIAVDVSGNVYVVDQSNHRIQQFSSTGVFISKWGTNGTGSGQFNNPQGIAIDGSGNVYVTDLSNNRVQKFSSSGTYITQWGTVGTGDGQLSSPFGIAVDGLDNVYVADKGNSRIQKFDASGTFLSKWGINGSSSGEFKNPLGIGIDVSSNIYVADQLNNRIQKFTSSGVFLLESGNGGGNDGQLDNPGGIAVDGSGNVYIADQNSHRIQKFGPDGVFMLNWGTNGTADGQFKSPVGVAVDVSGNVYVAERGNNRIQKFNSSGTYITKWGSNGSGDGQFNSPTGIAVDGEGNVYVADQNNYRIQKFTSSGTFLLQWGSYGIGDEEFMNAPGIAIDISGNVFVADSERNRIQKFTSSGNFLLKWGTVGIGDGQFYLPSVIATDAMSNVYVADNGTNRVQVFAPVPEIVIIGTLNAFATIYGTVSTEQSFTVSGLYLTADATLQVPSAYEISTSSSGIYQSTLTLSPTSGSVSATDIYVRLKADTPAGIVSSGDITLSTTGGVDQTLNIPAGSVSKASLSATADDQSKTYGSVNPTFTISYNGFVNGDDAANITEPTASTLATSSSNAGDYDITLSGGSAFNYDITLIDGTLSITSASLIATADDLSRTYGSSNSALTISYNGFVNGDDASDITEPTISCLADLTSSVSGSPYSITLSGGSAVNYLLTLEDAELTITPASLTITADDDSKTEGEANPAFTVNYSGFVNSEDESILGCSVAPTTSADNLSAPGDYTIEVADCGYTNTNYTYSFVNGKLTVNSLTGITNINYSKSVNIYPNPSNGKFTVSVDGEEIKSVRVINMLGEEEVFVSEKIETRFSGMLILEIKMNNGILIKKVNVK